MKYSDKIEYQAMQMDQMMSVCGAIPQGDELPQAPSMDDILVDIYSDILNMPHEYAAGRFHHQYESSLDDENLIH